MFFINFKRMVAGSLFCCFVSMHAQETQTKDSRNIIQKHPVISTVVAVAVVLVAGVLFKSWHIKNSEKPMPHAEVIQMKTRKQKGDQSDGLSAAYDLLCLMHSDKEKVKDLLEDETGVFWDIKRACDEAAQSLPWNKVRLLINPALRSVVGLDRFPKEVELASWDTTIIDDQKSPGELGLIGWEEPIPPTVKIHWNYGQNQFFLVRYQQQWTPLKFEKNSTFPGGVLVTTTDSMGKDQTNHPAIEKIYHFLTDIPSKDPA